MKPQQRKFIVEFKSARRRSAVKPTSIWGDTDLRALVREAETDAPHLFDAASGVDVVPNQSAEVFPQEKGTVESVPLISNPVAVPGEITIRSDRSEERSATLVDLASTDITTPQDSKRPRRVRAHRIIVEAIGTPVDGSAGDLTALEVENLALKRLLAQRLRQENIQLRRMLERFHVT